MNEKDIKNTRADLVIKEGESIKVIIEVKRAKSSNASIDSDLKRLSKYHEFSRATRCFLLLVSQNSLPKRFVDESKGELRNENIETAEYVARPRRLCKAAPSFKIKKSLNCACLIEVVCKNKT